MRKLLLSIHAYLGLLCVPYLLIFAISSLDFNHRFLNRNERELTKEWKATIFIPSDMEGEELGSAIRDSLDFFGWYVPWDSYSDSLNYHIKITHFGKEYEFDKPVNGNEVEIHEYSLSSGNMFFGLHALGENVPGAPWIINSWKFYQDLTVYSSIFWVITGVYLWAIRKRRAPISLWVLITASIFSLTLMTYLWLLE